MGAKIQHRRVERGLALRELARRIECSPSFVSDIEHDRRLPSSQTLERICNELDLDVDEMMRLAGKFGATASDYIRREPAAGVLFRKIARYGFEQDLLEELNRRVDQLANEGKKPPSAKPSEGK